MKEPTPRTSRLALAGGALALLAVAGTGFVVGRSSVAPAPVRPAPAAPAPAIAPPPVMQAEPERLNRAGLLALVSAMADAFASGGAPPADVAKLAGQSFTLALPFGCSGPLSDADATGTGWRYDNDSSALRLQVASTRWVPQDWLGAQSSADLEAVEGFWVARPWTSSETCSAGPAPAAASEPASPARQTLAIAQIFREDGPRQDRRDGEPYIAVVRSAPEVLRAESGFRVRVTGKLTDLPGGGAIHCRQPEGPDQQPICLIGATFDEITIENVATGETLARWPGGSGSGE